MAHHKDAIKRIRTSQSARSRNRANKSRMRGQIKDLRAKIVGGSATEADLGLTVSTLQRLARKGVLHKRNASRRVSRLAKAMNAAKKAAS